MVYLIYIMLSFYIIKICNERFKKVGILISVVLLYMLIAFQYDVGPDYLSYVEIFQGKKNFNQERGYGFNIYIELLRKISENELIFFIVSSLIQSVLFYNILMKIYRYRIARDIHIYIFLLMFSTYFYFSLFNTIRSTISALCVFNIFLDYVYLEQKKFKTAVIYMAIAWIFHTSSLMGIIILFLLLSVSSKAKMTKLLNVTYILLCFGAYKIELIRKIADYIYYSKINFYYKYYLKSEIMFISSEGAGIASIIILAIYIYSIMKCEEKNYSKKNRILFQMGIFTYGVSLIINESLVLNRMMEYYVFLPLFPIADLLEKLKKTKKEQIIRVIIILFFMTIFLKKIFYHPSKEYQYKNIFLNKIMLQNIE